MLKSGLLIAQKGFENAQSLVSSLMAAALGLSEALAEGGLRSLELSGRKIYVVSSTINPDVIVAVASDTEDPSIELRARELLSKIIDVIPPGTEIVTDDIQQQVQKLLDSFLEEKPVEMPYFDSVVDIAKVIYGNLPPEIIMKTEETINKLIKEEELKEKKLVHKPRKITIKSAEEALKNILDKVYSWDLIAGYDIAYSLATSDLEKSSLGTLLAIKIGLLTRMLPYNHPVIPTEVIKDFLKKVEEEKDLLAQFVKLEILNLLEDRPSEWLKFIRENIDELVKILDNTQDDILRSIYAFLLMSTGRSVIYSPLGERLLKIFKEKSSYLYEYLNSTYKVNDLFQILYTTKNWSDIEKDLAEIKTAYLKMKKRFHELLKRRLPIFRMLNREKIIEISYYVLSRIIPYLLISMAAMESYGLSIKDRHLLIEESYRVAIEDAYNIMREMPPLEIRAYFNFYQLLLHIIYYSTMFVTKEKAKEMWEHALRIAQEGLLFFARLWARRRISYYRFLTLSSPIIFVLSKAMLRLGTQSDEIISYLRQIAFIPPEIRNEINNERDINRALYLNTLMAFLPIIRHIQAPGIRARILEDILRIFDQIGERDIHKREVTREFIDDLADAVLACIKYSDDRKLCLYGLQLLKKYSTVIIRDLKENPFEATIAFERLGEASASYLRKFGDDEVVKKLALLSLENARRIWFHEGYTDKVREIDELIHVIRE